MKQRTDIHRKRRIQYEKKRKARAKRILAVLLTILIGSCGILFGSAFVSAGSGRTESAALYKYYKSIEIRQGDSLWKLAHTYMSDQYSSEQDYIKEVRQINHLASNTIYENQNLIVPYFDDVLH